MKVVHLRNNKLWARNSKYVIIHPLYLLFTSMSFANFAIGNGRNGPKVTMER